MKLTFLSIPKSEYRIHCSSIIEVESLTVEAGSLIVFFRETSLDLDSDAIVTAGFGLEKINSIVNYYNLSKIRNMNTKRICLTGVFRLDVTVTCHENVSLKHN